MPVRIAVLAAVVALAACTARKPAEVSANAALALTCGAPFAQDASAASLAEAFGAANATELIVPGPEGAQKRATVLFAHDPARRVELLWADEAARSGLHEAAMAPTATAWRGPGDLAIGATLEAVERANGGPFALTGFDWDYGGAVTDWRGGKFAPNASGCVVRLRFAPGDTAPEAARRRVSGDDVFASDSPDMRAVAPRIATIAIGYPAER